MRHPQETQWKQNLAQYVWRNRSLDFEAGLSVLGGMHGPISSKLCFLASLRAISQRCWSHVHLGGNPYRQFESQMPVFPRKNQQQLSRLHANGKWGKEARAACRACSTSSRVARVRARGIHIIVIIISVALNLKKSLRVPRVFFIETRYR